MDGLAGAIPLSGNQRFSLAGNHERRQIAYNGKNNNLRGVKKMPLLEGKNALIFGIANHRSIGWAIAQSLAGEGAHLAFTYQDRMEKYVRDLAAKIPGTPVFSCDVQNDEQLDAAFAWAGETFGGKLDILIHSVAFAPPRELENPFYETTREGYRTALDISAYSLIAMAGRAKPIMQANGGGAILPINPMGRERVIRQDNVMGP